MNRLTLFAVAALAIGSAQAQTKWDMPTPYSDGEFHTRNVRMFADDVKKGKSTSFPQAVKLKPGEVVWFSWILYKNRKHRDSVNKKVMKDKRIASMMDPKKMPFDGKRFFWGGFKVVVDL